MKRLLFSLLLLIVSVQLSHSQSLTRICYTTTGSNCVPAVASAFSKSISISTSTTTEIVALSTGKTTYVTSWDVVSGGIGTFKWVYGTGTACATGTTDLTGAYPLVAQAGISKGNGIGSVLIVPVGNALCVTTNAAVQMSGSVSYAQF